MKEKRPRKKWYTVDSKQKRWTLHLASGLLLFVGQTSFAEMSYLQLKGIDSIFRPECESIFPSHGFTALKTDILPNIRFSGNYGPIKEPFGCQRQIRPEQQNTDCPQDWTAALIQQLFPSPDTLNFLPNQGSSEDPLSKLPHDVIGRLLALTRKFNEIRSSAQESRIPGIWTPMVLEAFYPQSVQQERQKAKKDVRFRRASESELQVILSLRNTKRWKTIEPFSEIFFHALENQRRGNQNADSIYPPETVENTLLAYAWKRAHSKKDFLKLAQAIPECIQDENRLWILPELALDSSGQLKPIEIKTLASSENAALNQKRKAWLESTYKIEDYRKWISAPQGGFTIREQIQELNNHSELLAFYAHSADVLNNPLPPLVEGAEAAHKGMGKSSSSGRKYNLYPDCGEASLRNFFNIVLYDKEKGIFDATRLERIQEDYKLKLYKKWGKKNEKGLLAFYKGRNELNPETGQIEANLRNTDPRQVEDNRVRDDWSRRVASAIPAGGYLKGSGQCEMGAGIKNIQTMIGTLLGDSKLNQMKSPIEKWNRICELFSWEDPPFELDWTVQGGKKEDLKDDTNVTIEFSINRNKAFTWYFGDRHFSIQPIPKKKVWRDNAAQFITSHFADLRLKPGFLAWFVNENSIGSVSSIYPRVSLIWSFPLRNRAKTFDVLRFVFENEMHGLYSLVPKWIKQLSLDDPEVQRRMNALYADTGYPLAEDANHPGIVPRTLNYRPIRKEELEKTFGSEVAGKLGRAVKDPYGNIWGDTIHDQVGEVEMNWQQAMATCLALNSRWNPDIERELKEIMSNVDKNARYTAYGKLNEKVQSGMSTHGKACFVPSQRMWDQVSQDLKKSGSYVPQYLPNLYERWLWSSEADPHGGNGFGAVRFFDGYNGSIEDGAIYLRALVRCCCRVTAEQ